MTYVITQACIDVSDKSCIEVCPVDCIHEAGRMLLIDPTECIDCGACLPECPVNAIYVDEELPPELDLFKGINAKILDGPEDAAAVVDEYAASNSLPPIPGRRE